MSIISINNDCIQCGLCQKACPVNIVELNEEKRPFVEEGKGSACLECGQCLAICPKGALTHKTVDGLNAEGVELVQKRRSIRHFKDEKLSKGTMNKLFDLVRYAPTGGNFQPVKWVVISDKEKIKELLESIVTWMREMIARESELLNFSPMAYFVGEYEKNVNRISYDAPHIVVAYADENYWHGGLDCTISMSYLEMIATSMDIGTCWAGAIDFALKNNEELRKLIGIPDGYMNHNVMLMGKAKYEYHKIPSRKGADVKWL